MMPVVVLLATSTVAELMAHMTMDVPVLLPHLAPCLRTTADAKVDVDPGLLSFSEIMKRIVLMIGLKEREPL